MLHAINKQFIHSNQPLSLLHILYMDIILS